MADTFKSEDVTRLPDLVLELEAPSPSLRNTISPGPSTNVMLATLAHASSARRAKASAPALNEFAPLAKLKLMTVGPAPPEL